jgi:hypothetical protein
MGKKKSKSRLKLSIQDLKDLGIIKTRRKKKSNRYNNKKKSHNMDGIKSTSNHMVGYGSSMLTNNPTQQLNNENMVMQRDANLKAIKNENVDETRMTAYNPQLRQIEDNYRDVKGAITHLWNVHNHYGPKIEEIDDEVDIFDDNRNDYRYDSKDITKTLSSNEFIADGDNTPSMLNDTYFTPPKSAKNPFELRAGGGVTNKKEIKVYSPYFDKEYDALPSKKQLMDEPDDENISVTSETTHNNILKEQEKKKKVGAPNLSVDKVSLQKLYSDLGGDDVKLLTGKTQVMELRQAIRNLPQYKAILKYSKA